MDGISHLKDTIDLEQPLQLWIRSYLRTHGRSIIAPSCPRGQAQGGRGEGGEAEVGFDIRIFSLELRIRGSVLTKWSSILRTGLSIHALEFRIKTLEFRI